MIADQIGQELEVGDIIVAAKTSGGAEIALYKITEIYKQFITCERLDIKHKKRNVRKANQIYKIRPEIVTLLKLEGKI